MFISLTLSCRFGLYTTVYHSQYLLAEACVGDNVLVIDAAPSEVKPRLAMIFDGIPTVFYCIKMNTSKTP